MITRRRRRPVDLLSLASVQTLVACLIVSIVSIVPIVPTNGELDPPTDLQIEVVSGKIVHLEWRPPVRGEVSGYKVTIIPLSEQDETRVRHMEHSADDPFPVTLRDLTPGASYEVQLQSSLREATSNLFLSANFTTKPNTPGRFIVWFRNETTLLVLWQPPYPSGIFDQYRVAIDPEDALHSVLFVEKESEPPGPAQAAFYGLIPGRAYNISVQTVSQNQISTPTEAQYRTVPLPPLNVTVDTNTVTPFSFDVRWLPPKSLSEYDRYQVSLGVKSSLPKVVPKDGPRSIKFSEELEPGKTYEVVVKSVSGNVASWPATGNITTRPLPVVNLRSRSRKNGGIEVEWSGKNGSSQDSFMVRYVELEAFNSDGTVQVVQEKKVFLEDLLPGRNYSISVFAVSNGIHSEESVVYQPTKPAPPVIGILEPVSGSRLNVSWKSDVTSRQDSYQVLWIRNDTREKEETETRNNFILLQGLFPGAGYEIKVFAVSYGLLSDPHSYFQTMFPRSPENLQAVGATNSTILLTWSAPTGSLVDNYVVKYRPVWSPFWREVTVSNITSSEIRDLVAGERYVIRVTTISNKVESPDVREIEQTMYPNVVGPVKAFPASKNLTLEWSVPLGKVDYYMVVYHPLDNPKNTLDRQVLATNGSRVGERITELVHGLTPGELYSFNVYTVSNSLRSEGYTFSVRTMPVINSVVNIVIDEQGTKTLGIKYTPTPRKSVVFDRYKFQLVSDPSIPAQEKSQSDESRLVIFDNLIPGRLYNISIWTISGNQLSVPIIREARLYPEPVRILSAIKNTDTEITLAWDVPYGDKDCYEVTYLDPQTNHLIRNITFTERISYTSLKPHQNYSFVVTTLSGHGTATVLRSAPISQTFTTLESIPGEVAYFQPIDVKPNEVTLRWNLPQSEQNGVLTGFRISYNVKGTSVFKYHLFQPNDTIGTIYNLSPGKTYLFEIQAHTKVGPGNKKSWEEKMPIWAPPVPAKSVIASEVSHSSQSITVRFKKNFFSPIHGPVTAFTVIVAEEPATTEPLDLNLPSWYDVQKHAVWPPYQAIEPYFPFNGTIIEDFTIGSQDCDSSSADQRSADQGPVSQGPADQGLVGLGGKGSNTRYCNGPLKAGTLYRVKIRAFTRPDKFADTTFSFSILTDPDNTALIVGVTLPLSLLALLAVIILYLKHRRLGPFHSKQHGRKVGLGLGPIGRDLHDTMSIPEIEISSRPIKLKDFSEHFRHMSADSDFRFSEEFELLKHVGRDRPCTAADLPCNRPKNRFTNILPYDHSRIKLLPTDDEEGSDYINANYIPGFNSPREFIVTQGPLHSTRDDFWRSVWEQNSRAIVMLTKCVEKGREKCDHYWPYDTEPVYYGDIQVTVLNESKYPDWTISEFKVMRGDHSRIVRHFHFTTWPDFGVPEPPVTLVKFVRAFRDRVSPDSNKPIVVHCSAGVGRSGTFIALDRLLQHITKYDYVDILAIVYEMRKERVWMVQNEQQYICIHQCLLAVLEGKDLMDSPRPELHDNHGYEDDEGIAESGI